MITSAFGVGESEALESQTVYRHKYPLWSSIEIIFTMNVHWSERHQSDLLRVKGSVGRTI